MSNVSPKVGSNNVSTSSVNLDHETETAKTVDKAQLPATDTQAKPLSESAKQARVTEHNLSAYARQVQIAQAIPVQPKKVAVRQIDRQLMEAAKNNDLKKMEDLIKQGAKANSADEKGRTPLMYAAQAGSQQAIESLVKDHHAYVNAKDVNDQTALMKSAIMGKNDGVKYLLDNKAKIDAYDKFGRTALLYAARQDHGNVMKTLLSKNADPNIGDEDGRYPLMESAAKGNLQAVKDLIRKNADVNVQDDRTKTSPLMEAIENGNPTIVRILAKRSDADLQDSQGDTALMHLMRKVPPFGTADPAVVQTLIKKSKDVDIKNNDGRTALMEAGKAVDDVTVKALIERGADPSIQDKNGKSPLMDLIEANQISLRYFETLNVLVPKTNLDLQDTSGRTALIQAAMRGDFVTVKSLHAQGAKLDIADNQGRTALMEAAQRGALGTVKMLMDVDAASEGRIPRKADPFIRTGKRDRALEMAEQIGRAHV